MILDTEQQRELLLALITSGTFKGNAVDVVYELKKAIESAELTEK